MDIKRLVGKVLTAGNIYQDSHMRTQKQASLRIVLGNWKQNGDKTANKMFLYKFHQNSFSGPRFVKAYRQTDKILLLDPPREWKRI
jgi:hypothetical protein